MNVLHLFVEIPVLSASVGPIEIDLQPVISPGQSSGLLGSVSMCVPPHLLHLALHARIL